jgi:hypothetical protein
MIYLCAALVLGRHRSSQARAVFTPPTPTCRRAGKYIPFRIVGGQALTQGAAQ